VGCVDDEVGVEGDEVQGGFADAGGAGADAAVVGVDRLDVGGVGEQSKTISPSSVAAMPTRAACGEPSGPREAIMPSPRARTKSVSSRRSMYPPFDLRPS